MRNHEELMPGSPDDPDPQESEEWEEALRDAIASRGARASAPLVARILGEARRQGVPLHAPSTTPYVNTLAPAEEPPFPGDEEVEERIQRINRWNAAAMVLRANALHGGIGGHLSTYASAADLYEVGLNHFFRGKDHPGGGDQVFFQGHAAPGVYARAFLEGRIGAEQLDHFRREAVWRDGLSSYPHPRLMPHFWEFPTVSMGLGAINAVYQARFNRYLFKRGIRDTSEQRVWCFLGDGEMDEPESVGALRLAAHERLDNLTFVVNCNLQRLDGPVRGNGKIVQELEALFRGGGWHVIKVLWGREWDALLERDREGLLAGRLTGMLDGDFQRCSVEPGAYLRGRAFGPDPALGGMVEHLSDEELRGLRRGGHDVRKIHAAYHAATGLEDAPVAVLAKTVKGWGLGPAVEARNATHQIKKMTERELKEFVERLEVDVPGRKISGEELPFHHPGDDSDEVQYLKARRAQLGGFLPERRVRPRSVSLPGKGIYETFDAGTVEKRQEASTTMAFVRLLRDLMRDREFGPHVVPIVPDEARTFGMESLFKEFRIYAPSGQLYEPVDAGMLLSYAESPEGQILEEGITEAGSMASCTSAGTAYATHGRHMVPFFLFYSMFGFQRVGDLIWAFGDARGRGFLLGCTAGRTTLNGEGLQHEDGHSHLLASTVPNCKAYDPAFAYETAAIVEHGLRQMLDAGEDSFYYLTLYNEGYVMPPKPRGADEGILAGMYRLRTAPNERKHRVRLLGSGSILATQVLRAQHLLAERHEVAADVWSVTSYKLLAEEALEAERWNRLHPGDPSRVPYVQTLLEEGEGPVIAASDWMKAVPNQIAPWIPDTFVALGTDGYGRSDTRANLRRHFEVDAEHIVVAALSALARWGDVKPEAVSEAIERYGIDPERPDPRGDPAP